MDMDLAWLKPLMQFLNTNAGAVTALLTAVLVLTTVFYAIVTYWLFRETRLARLSTETPEVVAYLRPHERHISALTAHIENIGLGPAYNVQVFFEFSQGDADKYQLQHLPPEPRHLTNVMPARSSLKTSIGTYYELVEKEGEISPFKIHIHYKDSRGRKHRFVETFSPRTFEWLSVLGKPITEEIAEGLQEAAKSLNQIAINTRAHRS
jgi:hypothetical protein